MNREELIDKMAAAIEKMKKETNKGVIKDYEKKYKEALEVAKRKLCFDKAGMVDSFTPNDIYEMFPELKESEDERTWIINYLSNRILNSTIIAEKENLKKAVAWLERQGEQKPAEWSEEDERMIEAIEDLCDDKIRFTEFQDVKEHAYTVKNWLKSLKDRVQLQPKQEWSEEDAKTLNRISAILVDASEVKNWWKESRLIEREEMVWLTDFLKSFKDRYAFKPSKEQIMALRWVLNHIPYSSHKEEINGLLEQYLKGYKNI